MFHFAHFIVLKIYSVDAVYRNIQRLFVSAITCGFLIVYIHLIIFGQYVVRGFSLHRRFLTYCIKFCILLVFIFFLMAYLILVEEIAKDKGVL